MGDYSRDLERQLSVASRAASIDPEQRRAEEDAAWAEHEAQRGDQDGAAR